MTDGMLGGGATELQVLESQVLLLTKQMEGVKRAENTSSACARVIASIQKAEEKDGFVGGPAAADGAGGGGAGGAGGGANQYHSGGGGGSGSNGGGGRAQGGAEGGCCVVM
jgi:hypothetical protein